MLAHQITRQIEDHMSARTLPISLRDEDVVCVEDDDNPFVPAPIFFMQVAAPPPVRSHSRIRRSVILPWPAALMLLAIAGGFIYEHAQRGDLRQVVESSVHSAELASSTVIARISK
jgi:hypothetical protein